MEKLRQLLNSYEEYKEKETGYSNYDWRLNEINDEEEYEQWITAFRVDDSQLGVEESTAVIICKGYMFIKWLVENDKINEFEINTIMIKSNRLYHGKDKTTAYRVDENLEKVLLMLLSISDTPIDDLISYLD